MSFKKSLVWSTLDGYTYDSFILIGWAIKKRTLYFPLLIFCFRAVLTILVSLDRPFNKLQRTIVKVVELLILLEDINEYSPSMHLFFLNKTHQDDGTYYGFQKN